MQPEVHICAGAGIV